MNVLLGLLLQHPVAHLAQHIRFVNPITYISASGDFPIRNSREASNLVISCQWTPEEVDARPHPNAIAKSRSKYQKRSVQRYVYMRKRSLAQILPEQTASIHNFHGALRPRVVPSRRF